MTNEELYILVKGGAQPLVRVVEESTLQDEVVFDNGMVGRVLSAVLREDVPEFPFYVFQVREDEFREVNKPYMNKNWYDKSNQPSLTYLEAGHPPKNGVEECYCMPEDNTFELVAEDSLMAEYLKNTQGLTYTQYLEKLAQDIKQFIGGEDVVKETFSDYPKQDFIIDVCKEVLGEHPDKVNNYHLGKKALIGLFVGHVMKKTKGEADPEVVFKTLLKLLE